MLARIYRPSRTAMQSGKRKTELWVLEFEGRSPRKTDPLMGWTSSADTLGQVKMTFDTKEAAIAYAKEQRLPYQVLEKPDQAPVPKSYADNFAFRRRTPWTH
ncbi:NADH-ubiquinone oxidoreductase-related protein [Parvularcula bermudensis HTCC2503]|uniref:NADH-ubiquinone oxidoreductase-related protein n=1 Tax=Parvularcula bermudensis (strain ATCC BAA-594 / HTCC2503 / KCTC 12087) TaxID=314260 RepID=E0TBI9_PARBH|nr:ETC complex I subunit [Parvularcula bermudensis]ADM08364.1 NADH-ubiquinone oxidoreductase-related protein [Parvularcula bermudensis HTCC2503]